MGYNRPPQPQLQALSIKPLHLLYCHIKVVDIVKNNAWLVLYF